jgi:hypothetical protein
LSSLAIWASYHCHIAPKTKYHTTAFILLTNLHNISGIPLNAKWLWCHCFGVIAPSSVFASVFFLQIFIYRACDTNEIKSAALLYGIIII